MDLRLITLAMILAIGSGSRNAVTRIDADVWTIHDVTSCCSVQPRGSACYKDI